MLALFSMALFVVPVVLKEAHAQPAGTIVSYCFSTSTGNLSAVVRTETGSTVSVTCADGSTPKTGRRADKGVCVKGSSAPYSIGNTPTLDVNGNPKCTSPDVFKPFPSTSTTTGGGTGSGTGTGTGNNTGGSGTGTSTQTTTTPSSTPSAPSVPCGSEPGFHQVGPLCVPKNPFSNDSIAGGNQTASSLAVRIIKILLYLAGIVAVIFIIIGGYYIMTARGNETQALSGRKTLINALVGLAIILLAYVIVQVVINFITK